MRTKTVVELTLACCITCSSVANGASAPTANDDAFGFTEDSPPQEYPSVLTNDTDGDGDSLSVVDIGGDDVNSILARPDEFRVILRQSMGIVRLNRSDGTMQYEARENFCGNWSIEYTISDGIFEATATAQVTVECVNDVPHATADSFNLVEGSRSIDVPARGLLVNDYDPDSDLLVSSEPVVDPLHGSLTLNSDGSFYYWTNLESCEDDYFEYEIRESGESQHSATASVNLECLPSMKSSMNGVWWDPQQPGMAISVQAFDDQALLTWYSYDEEGRPNWWVTESQFEYESDGTLIIAAELQSYGGGQCPTCGWVLPYQTGSLDGFEVRFTSRAHASVFIGDQHIADLIPYPHRASPTPSLGTWVFLSSEFEGAITADLIRLNRSSGSDTAYLDYVLSNPRHGDEPLTDVVLRIIYELVPPAVGGTLERDGEIIGHFDGSDMSADSIHSRTENESWFNATRVK